MTEKDTVAAATTTTDATTTTFTTSQKYQDFLREPMGRKKPVTAIPGIGPATAEKMEPYGIEFAYQVWGKFLLTQMSDFNFKMWLIDVIKMSPRYANVCYAAMRDYSDAFLL